MPLPYILFILIALLPFFFRISAIGKKSIFFILLLFIVLVTGLRSEYVGADSVQYYFSFSELNKMSLIRALDTRYDAGYVLFARSVGHFFSSPYAFFFIVALLTFSVAFFFFRRYSKHVFFSILIFFCLEYADFSSLMRQSMALCFLFCSIPFLLRNNIVLFFLFVAVATQFHASAIVGILFFFLDKLRFSRRTIVIFLLSAIVLFLLNKAVWLLVAKMNIGAYALYVDSAYNSMGTSIVNDFIIKVFPSMLFLFLGLKSKEEEMSREENLFFMLSLMNVALSIVALSSLIIGRLCLYFSFAIPIVASYIFLPTCRYKFKPKRLYVNLLLIFVVSFFCVIQIMRPNWMRISPYSPYWAPVNAYGISAAQYFW